MSSPSLCARADIGSCARVLLHVAALLAVACVRGQQVLPDGLGAEESLTAQTQTFLADKVRRHPVWASANRLDGEVRNQLGDHSQAARGQELAWLAAFAEGLPKAVNRNLLRVEKQVEYDVLAARVESDQFALREVRPWERDPNRWLQLAAESVSTVALREDIPLEDRMRAVTARLEKWPELFSQARGSLGKPARLWTELALSRAGSLAENVRKGLPDIFAPVEDPGLHRAFQAAQGKAFDSVIAFAFFLRDDLLPVSRGSFALGAPSLSKWLKLEEGLTDSPDTLWTWSQDEVGRAQGVFAETGRKLDAKHPAPEVLTRLLAQQPEATELLNQAQETLDALFAFVGTKGLVSLPTGERVRIVEAPLWVSGGGFANLEGSLLYLTFAAPGASAEKTAAQARFFARAALPHILAHEAYPGRYTALRLADSQLGSALRYLGPAALPQGWALYCEQLIADEGFAKEGPGREAIRLVQTARYLVSLARLRAMLAIHTRGAALPAAVEQFRKDAYTSQEEAQTEVQRVTYEPLAALDVLGVRELRRLRKEFHPRGNRASGPREFHDRILKSGRPTWPALRRWLFEGSPK